MIPRLQEQPANIGHALVLQMNGLWHAAEQDPSKLHELEGLIGAYTSTDIPNTRMTFHAAWTDPELEQGVENLIGEVLGKNKDKMRGVIEAIRQQSAHACAGYRPLSLVMCDFNGLEYRTGQKN